jgi:hypothetical protein
VHGRQREARAAHAERVAEGNGAAVGVHAGVAIGDAHLAQHRQRLRRERLVQLDHVHVVEREARQFQCPPARRHRSHPHDPRLHARRRAREDSCARRQAMRLQRALRSDEQRRRAVVQT